MKLRSVAIFVLSLAAVSCELFEPATPDPAVQASLTLKTTEAANTRGNQFVQIVADGEWTLTIDGKISPDTLDWVWLTTFGADDVQLPTVQGSGSSSTITFHWAANSASTSRSCTLVLTTGGSTFEASFVQAASDGGYTDGPDLPDEEPEGVKYGAWMELPAIKTGSGLYFITHDYTSGTQTKRNYSFNWDVNALVAHWVAYPLNSGTTGTGSRTNEWGLDPSLPRDKQPVLLSGFRGGYDRGHQLPSYDRLTYSANVQTFYGTNMTPQIGTTFNQTVWADVEGRVHSWSQANGVDTLYVVTGCVLDGSLGYAYDNDGKAVTVPGAYYKALLLYSGATSASRTKMSSLSSTGYYTCIAFWYDHQGYPSSEPMKDHALSINELERLTGENFFPALNDNYEETIEDRCDYSWWNNLK